MYKFYSLIKLILKFYVYLSLRKKKLIVIVGLRRSGNHACIQWIANSIKGSQFDLQLSNEGFYSSDDGEILHLNNINTLSNFGFIYLLQRAKSSIKKAKTVLVTFEDYIPTSDDIYPLSNATVVYIDRKLLI